MENNFENENLMNDETEEIKAEELEFEADDEEEEVVLKKLKRKNMKREIIEWVVAIAVAFVLAFIIRTFFFTLVAVDGPSMNNTLQHGERLVISRFNYTPKQGDIIVFTPDLHPNTPYIKRVIATEGQTVDIDSRGIVYIDGKVLEEDYIISPTAPVYDETRGVQFPITVPEDCVFVMGDNRPGSHDGRSLDVSSVKENPTDDDEYYTVEKINADYTLDVSSEALYYGCVHEDDIMGKAVFRFWPFGRFGGLK